VALKTIMQIKPTGVKMLTKRVITGQLSCHGGMNKQTPAPD
jgi:hypothetical protein